MISCRVLPEIKNIYSFRVVTKIKVNISNQDFSKNWAVYDITRNIRQSEWEFLVEHKVVQSKFDFYAV
jgi:hypothetical protein